MLRHDQVAEAARWLTRLEKKEPQTARTLLLTARLLAKQGQGRGAARLIGDYVRKEFATKKEPGILAAGAGLLEELNQERAAEDLYRQYVTEARAKQPDSVLQLAAFLARQKRLSEALDLCEGAWQKCKPEAVATVGVGALRVGKPKEQDFQRVEGWLEKAIHQHPESLVSAHSPGRPA